MRKGNKFFLKSPRPSLPLKRAPPRRSEPLRSKDGGPSKVSPDCTGWDRLGIAVYSLQLIVYSLRLISWLFADNLQISC